MRHVKTLVLLIALFPTTAFAENIVTSDENNSKQIAKYQPDLDRLNADSDRMASSLFKDKTATGTTSRSPSSEGFQVTLVKRNK